MKNNIDSDLRPQKGVEPDKPYTQIVVAEEISKNYDISPEFNIKIKSALERRLEASWDYTGNRIDRINESISQYQAQQSNESTDAIIKTSLMVTRTWSEDWIDIFAEAMGRVKNSISINDSQNKTKGNVKKSFDVEPEALNKKGIMRTVWEKLVASGETENFEAKHEYKFDKKQVVKASVESLLEKSGMYDQSLSVDGRNAIEELCYHGVVTGMFAIVNCLESSNNIELEVDNGRAVISQGARFKFDVADPRSLIFPLAQKMPWFARIKTAQFSDLLASATNDEGGQNENSYYNLKRLNTLAKYIRENKDYPVASSISDMSDFESGYDSDSNIEEMLLVDEMVTILEFHYVPLVFEGDKKATRSLVTAVCMDKIDFKSGHPSLFIIGARKTPFIYGIPLHFTNFAYDIRQNDPQGFGLPSVVCEMSSRIQKTVSHIADLITRALKGIHFILEECVDSMDAMETLQARTFIPLKNTNGMPLSSIIQSWLPDTQAIQLGMNFLEMLKQTGKTISRSGLSGESIKSGQVSATEYSSVKRDIDKQVTRPVNRLASMIDSWLLDMYRYSAMYCPGNMEIACQGKRIFDEIDSRDQEFGAVINDTEMEHEKEFELDVTDWFVNGIGFTVKSITNEQTEAIAKQQAMEAINLLLGKGLVIDPNTGKPFVITNEDGKKMVVDIESIITEAFSSLGYKSVFMPAPEEPMQVMPPQMGGQGGQVGGSVELQNPTVNPQLGGNL